MGPFIFGRFLFFSLHSTWVAYPSCFFNKTLFLIKKKKFGLVNDLLSLLCPFEAYFVKVCLKLCPRSYLRYF